MYLFFSSRIQFAVNCARIPKVPSFANAHLATFYDPTYDHARL